MKILAGLLLGVMVGVVGFVAYNSSGFVKQGGENDIHKPVELPLIKYEFDNLRQRNFDSDIKLLDIVSSGSGVLVQKFEYISDGKRVSGAAHIPESCKKCPIIIQTRGYHPLETYSFGAGTKRSAMEYAKAGFISLAPDFLGYGSSDNPSSNVWEARFETYTSLLNLIAGAKKLGLGNGKIGLWGHSNGGQIVLSALAISSADYPTILWAPVTSRFPYSVLYYTFDYEDGGKILRKSLSEFESNYDVDKYYFGSYLDQIQAEIVIHQGLSDPDIPIGWSRGLVNSMRSIDKEIKLIEYLGMDHNMQPRWQEVVDHDINFFAKKLRDD